MLNVIMLSVVMLNVIMLNVIMLSVIMLSVIMRSVIMQSVIMLNVVTPTKYHPRIISYSAEAVKALELIFSNLLRIFLRSLFKPGCVITLVVIAF